MKCYSVMVFGSFLLHYAQSLEYKFPENFKFGAASSSYQVEGGWNTSDKGVSIWDHLLHTRPEVVADRSNGDVACDSYHLWERDIKIVEEMGLNMYRFSISWTRLLPTGYPNKISEDGKRYYNNLIDGLLAKGIEPMVTLYHFDLPQSLQDLGGWANPHIINLFVDYANVVFSLFGDRVKLWLTLNEPLMICDFGYMEIAAPYIDDKEIGRYLCNKNVLLGHAKVYRLYDEVYKPRYNGKVSLAIVFFWFVPETPEDIELAELANDFWTGRYDHAIYSNEGGWPKKLENILLKNGEKEGYPYPRLPPFTPEETKLVKGTYDFYGLNHYTTRTIHKLKPGEKQEPWPLSGIEDLGVNMGTDPLWKASDIFWLTIYPEGLHQQLHWLNTHYDVKEIIITENGLLTFDDSLADTDRLECIKGNLEKISLAINEGVPVAGYTAWAMMDSFEWLSGYSVNFGLYAVDFNDPNRTRTPRESARFYASVAKSKAIYTKEDVLNTLPL